MLLLGLLLSLSYLTSATKNFVNIGDKCLPPGDIPKCKCEIKYRGIRITCDRFASDDELRQHLKRMKGYSIAKLEISNHNASSFPIDLFDGLHIGDISLAQIEVTDNSFNKGKRHFQGLENSLTALEIRKSFRIQDRPPLNLPLDHLKNLQVAIFEDNNIPEVNNDWFASGIEKLDVLIFERNNIKVLGDHAFSSLKTLKVLAVAGNHLRTISRSMLPKTALRLITLDLAYNKIHALPTDIFSGMPSLQDLNLESNLIHMLQQDTWSSIFSRLDTLKLGGNGLQCDAEMKWICEARMPSAAHGKCGSPAEKKGLTLQQFCKQ